MDVDDIIEAAGNNGGGQTGGRRWELITAAFGWIGVLAILLGIIGLFLNIEWSGAVVGLGFSSAGVAIKRDYLKLFRTGRMLK